MAITRWDPFGEMLQMQRDMDRIFTRMGSGDGGSRAQTTAWMPRINVKQAGDDLAVHVELAGIKPEDVDIEVTDDILTIRGERNAETEREDEGWMVRESSYGSFERSIALPSGVDPASIQADFHDGMLEIHVPKALAAAQPRTTKVAISSGAQQGGAQGEQGRQQAMGEPPQQGAAAQGQQGQRQAMGEQAQQGAQGQQSGQPPVTQQPQEQSPTREPMLEGKEPGEPPTQERAAEQRSQYVHSQT